MFRKLTKRLTTNPSKAGAHKHDYEFVRKEFDPSVPGSEIEQKLINLLNFTKTSGTSYAATDYEAGYHTIELGGQVLQGQRNPTQRLKALDYDFTNRCLLDVGCNQGGMMFAVADKIKWGVGIDYDFRMINACNAIRSKLGVKNCDFYIHDIDALPMELLEDYLPENRVDIVFLLAVCMWIDRWRELISFLAKMSDNMLFETNGKPDQQDEQWEYLKSVYADVRLISDASTDDPSQKKRRLCFCSRPFANT